MRHKIYGKHFGRDKDERKNLFKGLVHSLLLSGTIQTSETKAKAIKGLIDKIINSAKKEVKTPGQPLIHSFLSDKSLKDRMINDILPKLGTKTSGYTRIIKMGTRLGDQTMMVKMSLIGAEELKPIKKAVSEEIISKVAKVSEVKKELITAKKETRRTATKRRVSK